MLPKFNAKTLGLWYEAIVASHSHLAAAEAAKFEDTQGLISWAEQGGVEADAILQAMATALGIEWLEDVSNIDPSPEFIDKYPISLARQHCFAGGTIKNNTMPVLAGSVSAVSQLDHVRRCFGVATSVRFAPHDLVLDAVNQAYQRRGSETEQAIKALDRDEIASDKMKILSGGEDLLESIGKSPIIKLTNSLIFDAIKIRASDIHIQPYEKYLQIRFRIDGVLFDQARIPKESQEEILSRVKVMGKMNIAEKRLPQDGRASVSLGDRNIDLRIASLPTSHGERVVIRLLDKGAKLFSLPEIGMSSDILLRFRKLIQQEHGLFLVTGPTGGGKSTTLYAALQEINVTDKNVVTLEDPIEYQLDGISQTQINEKKGLTFARGLRNVLRQDPDIIMVGEIRDRETAEMAIQSALTGHMVYSTLHTNDATSAVTRLLDLGIEPYLVASSVVGVLAQRLVRQICPTCKVPVETTEANLSQFAKLAQKEMTTHTGTGCQNCRQTGYQGRIGVFEMMLVTEAVQSLIQRRCNAAEIRKVAVEEGMRLLRDDGFDKVGQGMTTLEEVYRVSMDV